MTDIVKRIDELLPFLAAAAIGGAAGAKKRIAKTGNMPRKKKKRSKPVSKDIKKFYKSHWKNESSNMRIKLANQYINKIKNPAKKEYAKKYMKWLQGNQRDDSPDKGKLSYMAAQSVRMQLFDILQIPDVSGG